MKKNIKLLSSALILLSSPLFALEMGIRLTPSLTFPMGEMAVAYKSPVWGGTFNYDVNFLDLINCGPEASFNVINKKASSDTIFDFSTGINAGVHYAPISRLMLQGGISAGVHFMNYHFTGIPEQDGTYLPGNEPATFTPWHFYLKAEGSASFRINPNLSAGASLGYVYNILDTVNGVTPFLSGLQIGLTAKYTFDTNKNSGKLSGNLILDEPLYPLYTNMYKVSPFGTYVLKNTESAEIKNVQVSFRSDRYSASEILCGEVVPKITKGKTYEFPIYADFSNEILKFTENGQIQGDIIVNYELLGKKRTYIDSVVIPVNNRNAIRWVDPAIVSVMVSPNANEILELSKNIVGIARDELKTGLNRNLQFAIYVVEAINAMGIDTVRDNLTPYEVYHSDDTEIDTIQYPYQTLTYNSGDCDDMGILLMALLESVGIDSAYIPLSKDFITLINLGSAKSALSIISNEDWVIVIDDEAWLPLSMKNLRDGFYGSWIQASNNLSPETDEYIEMVLLRDAWKNYPPVGVNTKATYSKPHPDEIKKLADKSLKSFFDSEINPKIQKAKNNVAANANSENLNGLGLLYVRSGDYKNAKETFARSAKTGNISAMTNLANLYLMENDFTAAENWYKKVLEINPVHKGALKGLERIVNERGN